jgi:hypothetical protein
LAGFFGPRAAGDGVVAVGFDDRVGEGVFAPVAAPSSARVSMRVSNAASPVWS